MTLNSERVRVFGVEGGVSLFFCCVLVFFFTLPFGGRLQRLNYRVSCIVVLLSFTVIAHHLKAHSYNQITCHRNVLFSGCTCESS